MSVKNEGGCTCAATAKSIPMPSFMAIDRGCAGKDNVSFTIKIGNIGDILKAYGVVSAVRVVQAVSSVISRLDGRGTVEVVDGHQLLVSFSRDRLADGVDLRDVCEGWLRHVCRSVALVPFWTEWGVVHVWLSGRWSATDADGEAVGSDWLFSFAEESAVEPGEGAARYRRDMVVASKLLCALARAEGGGLDGGALRIVWRPVVERASCEVLYYQATVRFEEAVGDPWLARNALAVVERIGFGGIIDEIVVRATVAELEGDPDVVLSAAVSSVGVVRSAWWASLAGRLERRPEIAARLVLEISESAALARSIEVGRFCNEARRLGCRVAISDFGAGFASVRQLVTITPDIVKIDCGFVRRSTTSSRDREILAGLRHLAGAIAAIVVADGVDTFAQAQLADELGLAWQQGHFWGNASTCRPWCGARPSVQSRPALLAG